MCKHELQRLLAHLSLLHGDVGARLLLIGLFEWSLFGVKVAQQKVYWTMKAPEVL